MKIKIKKGLNLAIAGAPEQQVIHEIKNPDFVALIGEDYPGLRAKLLVQKDERVKQGQPLFMDKQSQVHYTAPFGGIVSEINLGKKRALQSVVIKLDGNEALSFQSYESEQLSRLNAEVIIENLTASGLWTALRTRPYGKTPNPNNLPHSIFITAMDTQPLAADPTVIINEYAQDFKDGLTVVANIAAVSVYVCHGDDVPLPDHDRIKPIMFVGPHPAGLVGTHIHYLDPVSLEKTIWYIHYQDVIAMGKLFTSGHIWPQRIISLAGPGVIKPRLISTHLGVDIKALAENELKDDHHRLISGSVLSGRAVNTMMGYLGRFHYQISVIKEGGKKTWLECLLPKQPVDFDTFMSTRPRVIIPLDNFERIMPLDILPTPLLKALLVGDLETAQSLGCLELEEEDLALCAYVCCGHQDYGYALRTCLTKIEQENQ